MTRPVRSAALSVGAAAAVVLSLVGCTSDDAPEGGSVTSLEQAGAEATGTSTDPTEAAAAVSTGEDASSTQTVPDEGQPVELGPLGSTELDLGSADGDVQIGAAAVPSLVPVEFPVPDDLTVQLASETASDAGFSGETAMGFDDLVAFYSTELEQAGYAVTEDQFVADTVAVLGFIGPDGSGQVAISVAPGRAGRSVIVTYQR